jgi:4-amino-4-deoxy-L-arabinose transferase-like glycosyltransferase
MDIIKTLYLKRKLHFIVIGLAFFIFSVKLHDGPLRTYDECYYAGQAKEILVTGDAFTMHHALNPNYENDPVYLWSMALMFKLFGVSEFCSRFPSAVYGALSVLMVFLTAARLRNYRFALVSSLILAATWEFIRFSRYAHLDVCLSFFTAAAIYFFIRHELAAEASSSGARLRYAAGCGICAGLAILSKNILGAFAIIAIVVYYLIKGDFKSLFSFNFAVIALGAAALPGAWYLYQYNVNGLEFFRVHFGYILLKRAADNPVEAAPAYQYLKILLLTYIPWLPIAAAGIFLIIKDFMNRKAAATGRNQKDILFLFGVIFVIVYIGVMSMASAKKGWYIMPVYSQLAIICAFALERFFARGGVKKKDARKKTLVFISRFLFFMFFAAFIISVFPVKLYKNDNGEYKNEIAAYTKSLSGAAYNKKFIFQPAGFDCDYFDYQLPLVFYTGIIPRHSIGAAEILKAVREESVGFTGDKAVSGSPGGGANFDRAEITFFSERDKFKDILKTAGLSHDSCEVILKTASFIIYKIK